MRYSQVTQNLKIDRLCKIHERETNASFHFETRREYGEVAELALCVTSYCRELKTFMKKVKNNGTINTNFLHNNKF